MIMFTLQGQLLRWCLLSAFLAKALAACYFPDGTLATNDTPCRDDTENSVCCGQGYACLSNGICQATGEELQKPGATEFVRGGCTDKSWRSSNCPLFCIDPDVNYTGGGMGLAKCENTNQDLYYCINSEQEDVSCKERKGLIFFAGTPTARTTIGISPKTRTITAEPDEPSTSSYPPKSSLTTAVPSTTLDPVTTETDAIKEEDLEDPGTSPGVIAGGAVGGVVAFALIGGAVWWFLRRRKVGTLAEPMATLTDDRTIYDKHPKHATWFSGGGTQEVDGGYQGWANYQHAYELDVPRSAPQELPTQHSGMNVR